MADSGGGGGGQHPSLARVAEKSPTGSESPQQRTMRRAILALQRDTSLTPRERARRTQALLAGKHAKHAAASPPVPPEPDSPMPPALWPAYHKEPGADGEGGILGCKHYQRGCLIRAACCGDFYGCRFCHDEQAPHRTAPQVRPARAARCAPASASASASGVGGGGGGGGARSGSVDSGNTDAAGDSDAAMAPAGADAGPGLGMDLSGLGDGSGVSNGFTAGPFADRLARRQAKAAAKSWWPWPAELAKNGGRVSGFYE